MKILIFSDTHLTTTFKKSKFEFLKKIINNCDQVIIAGDFWEGRLITFDEFIDSEWNMLFPLLKEKHTIYVYGNHDKKIYSDERVRLFSDEQEEKYEFTQEKNKYIVKHGDTKKIKYSIIKAVADVTFMSERFFTKHMHEDLEHVFVRLFGKNILQLLFKKYNNVIKEQEITSLKENQIVICGHTHAAEMDLENKFVNTGIIRHGLGQYVIINGDNIKLHEEKY